MRWLQAGVTDFKRTWPLSFSYGLVIAAASYLLVNNGWNRPALALTLTIGFLMIGSFLALGFYDLSARLEQEGRAAFSGVKRNLASIGMYGVLLAFIVSVWERVSAILIGLYVGSTGVSETSVGWLFSFDNPGLLILYGGFALLLSVAVFSLSVVSLPMLMDRKTDIVTALMTSLWVVRENPGAMGVWVAAIVGLTTLGALSWFVGLAFLFPILGHATWHAYRDVVAG
jgi:uncharacterized membrane protein